MILKKILFAVIFFSLTNSFAQTNTNFMVVNPSGHTFEVDPATCTITPLSDCTGGRIASIALIGSMIYFTDGASLYRYPYNTSGACEFLVAFPAPIIAVTGLTSGPGGLIYAAQGNTILSYDPATNSATNLGTIPSQWQSSGDLIFHGNDLLLTTTNEQLVKIDLNNLSNSQAVLSFPSSTVIYGLATVSTPCSTNLVFGLNAMGSGGTELLPLNLVTNTIGSSTCILPFTVFDAASLSENGSTGGVLPTFTAVAPVCSGDVILPLPTTSTNGITGTWAPALNNTATTVYTFTPTAGLCATTTTMKIVVNPIITPIFTPVGPFCSGATIGPLPTSSTNSIAGTWSPAIDNTAITTYTFTPTSGLCATPTTLTITIFPVGTPIFAPIAPICSGDILLPLPTTSTNGISGTWSPALDNTATTVYTFTPSSTCAASVTLTVPVIPAINITLNEASICIDPQTLLPKYQVSLTTNLTQINYTYNWYLDGNVLVGQHANDLVVNQTGQYYVEVTDTSTNCVSVSNTVVVNQINVIDDFNIEVTGEFTDNASITINPFSSDLLYQIDNRPFQISNFFENVSYGFHSISVVDSILCTDFKGVVFVPGYPKFFTPNGDGYNDSWNVIGFNPGDIYKVYISDRYGKFLHQITNNTDGWDGKLNGSELPATDYWFVVNYYLNNQNKTFNGHFSLKR